MYYELNHDQELSFGDMKAIFRISKDEYCVPDSSPLMESAKDAEGEESEIFVPGVSKLV